MTGEFVLSISGRDKGRVHVIVACDAEKDLFYICDGKTRRLERPKPKKLKHIKLLSVLSQDISNAVKNGTLTNKMVMKCISAYERNQE